MEKLIADIGSNLRFLGGAILIIGIIFALAKLAERYMPQSRKVTSTRRITIIAICGAIASI